MIDAIGEAFDSRDRELRVETEQAKETANHLQGIAGGEAERRFAPWLERALVKGLDQWRRGE